MPVTLEPLSICAQMPDLKIPEIRDLHLFAEMKDAHFNALMRASYMQNFPPQIELITEGEPSDFLHVVVSGAVDLFSTWNRRETSLATVEPVSTFILAATIKDAPYLMSARTLEKSRIVLIPSQDVRAIFAIDALFARAIVTDYLLRLQRSAGADAFELPTEKRRLASLLGMTPENLSRAFKNLQSYGVMIEGSQVVLHDRADLERFAKPSPLIDDETI